jgi:hypothetical protein
VRTAALLICALLAGTALAQPATPKPDALTPDGARYYGPLRNGKLHGEGKLTWANGTVYQGGFADGLMSGRGKVRWANGQAYEGEFRDGMMDGRGRMTTPDGAVYEGEFKRSFFNGQGEIVYPDGRKYAGEFVLGNFQGKGRYETREGARYEGEFLNWRMHGKGRFTDPGGNVYEGTFVNGEFDGNGTLSGPQGNRYAGEFKQWRFQGQGELRLANGDVYRGGFANGHYDGQGTLTFGKPRPDGTTQQSGLWRYGMLESEQREERRLAAANVETALYNQRSLLAQAIGALGPRDPGRINLFLLAVGGDGSQEVFRREVEFVRQQFDATSDTRGRSIALVNSRSTIASAPMATLTSVREALGAIAARMDLEQDILFLFITSHGSADHELTLNQAGMSLRGLKAGELAEALRASGIRWKAVVVSACYAGGFIDYLKDERSLVLAAARHDRRSFGCADENDFTYFGRAFFKDALPSSGSFQDAFQAADSLIREREGKELKGSEDAYSLPQMHDAPAIRAHLQRWWAQRATPP